MKSPIRTPHRWLRRVGLIVGTLVVVLMVVGLGAYWLLTRGQISLARFEPEIERQLNSGDLPWRIELEDISLRRSGWYGPINIGARHVRILGGDGAEIATLSEVDVGLHRGELFRRRIAPLSLTLSEVDVTLVRDADGSFRLGLGDYAPQTLPDESGEEASWLRPWFEAPDPTRPLGRLGRIDFRDARLEVDDRVSETSWGVESAHFVLERSGAGFGARLSFDPQVGGRMSPVTVELRYVLADRALHGRIEFDSLEAARLAHVDQRLALFETFREPVSGWIETEFGDTIDLKVVRFDIQHEGTFRGRIDFDDEGRASAGQLRLEDVRPWALAGGSGALAVLKHVRTPMDGSVEFGLAAGKLQSLDFDLHAHPGELRFPALDEPLPVREASIRGKAADAMAEIHLDEARIELEASVVTLSASARRDGDRYDARLHAVADRLGVEHLPGYWPKNSARGARAWVRANVPEGMVRGLGLELNATLDVANEMKIEIGRIDGSFAFDDLSVVPLAPQPAVEEVKGTASFTREAFNFVVLNGRMSEIEVDRATVSITGLRTERKQLLLDLDCESSLPAAVRVLTREPLAALDATLLEATDLAGQASTTVKLAVPLSHGDDTPIEVTARADLEDAAWSAAPLGLRLDRGDLTLAYEDRRLLIEGDLRANGVPTKLAYEEFLADADMVRRIRVEGRVDDDDRRALGIPDQPFLSGPAGFRSSYLVQHDGTTRVVTDLDLRESRIDLTLLSWSKPPATPGTAHVEVVSRAGGAWTIEGAELDAADLEARGRLELDLDPLRVHTAELERLEYAGNQVHGRLARDASGGYVARLEGSRLDVGPFLRRPGDQGPGDENASDGGEGGEGGEDLGPEGRPGVTLDTRLDHLLVDGKTACRDLVGRGVFDGIGWREVVVDGRFDSGKTLALRWGPDGNGASGTLDIGDAGQMMTAFNLSDGYEGGELTLTAGRDAPEEPILGRLEVRDVTLKSSPTLAHVLRAASFSGLLRSLHGEGLRFKKIECGIKYLSRRLEIVDGRLYGEGIGITVAGTADWAAQSVSMNGAVAPSGTLRRALGKVPLLGKVLTGRHHEGFLAVLYKVEGPIKDPKVEVQTYTALAPGILRELFKLKPSSEEESGGEADGG